MSRILRHLDVEALLLGVDELQHFTVEAFDPCLAVDRGRERLPAALELAHDPLPLGDEIYARLMPPLRVLLGARSPVGCRIRHYSFVRGLSPRRRILRCTVGGGPRGVRCGPSVLCRFFEGLEAAKDSCQIRFRVIADELEEDELQFQLRITAAAYTAQGV